MPSLDREPDGVWLPLPIGYLFKRFGIGDSRVRTVIALWGAATVSATAICVVMVHFRQSGITATVLGINLHITAYPPVFVAVCTLLWLGADWAALTIFVSTLAGSLYAGVSPVAAIGIGLADVALIGVYLVGYRAIHVRSDLRSIASATWFVVVSFIAALVGSAGALVYASSLGAAGTLESLELWENWWLGDFAEVVLVGGPVVLLFGGRIQRALRRALPHPPRNAPTMPGMIAAIATGGAALAVFVILNTELAGARLAAVLDDSLPITLAPEVQRAIHDWDVISWVSIALVLLAATGAAAVALSWNRWLVNELGRRFERLQTSEERFRTLVDGSPSGVMILDPGQGRFLSVNHTAVEMFGYERDLLLDRSLADLCPALQPDGRASEEAASSYIAAALAGEETSFEWTHRRSSGELFPCVIRLVRFPDPERDLVQATVDDVTLRREREAELERVFAIIDNTPDFVGIADNHMRVVYVNPAGRRMLGLEPDEDVSKYSVDHFHPDRFGSILEKEIFPAVRETGCWTGELTMVNRDGKEIPTSHVLMGHFLGDGSIDYFSTIARDLTLRERDRIEVERLERKTEQILRTTLDGYLLADSEATILDMNESYCGTVGYSREDLLGTKVWDLDPAGRETIEGWIEEFVAKGGARFETQHRHRDGHLVDLDVSLSTVTETDPPLVAAFVRDITDQKRIQDERERNLSFVRATLESTADGILVVDHDGRIVGWNGKYRELWNIPKDVLKGGSEDEAINKVLPQLTDPAGFVQRVKEIYSKPDEESFDLVEFSDGRAFERYSLPQRLGDRIVGRVWSFRDVTERTLAEEKLRRSEENYRELVDYSPLGMYRVSPDGTFLSANPALVEMLQLETVEDLIGESILQFYVDSGDRDRVLAQDTPDDLLVDQQLKWRRADGTPITLRATGRVVRAEAGEVLFYEVVAQDISKQLLLEEELRHSQRMEAVGSMTGGIAHDFNNLLTVIIGSAELIDQAADSPSNVRNLIATLSNAANKSAELVRKLLTFSQSQPLVLKPLDIGTLLDELQPILRQVIPENVAIEVTVEPDTPPVLGDHGSMEQILVNLAANARDVMRAGGVFRIAAARCPVEDAPLPRAVDAERFDSCLRLTVSDTGDGMTAEVKRRIFDPFFTTKEPGEGTGLGLATVYGLVTKHNGHVAVESEPGQGTTFTIILPATHDTVADPATPGGTSDLARETGTILLVEDEPEVRRTTTMILERAGFTVISAADGFEALEVCSNPEHNVSLLVSDVVMPRMGGPELIRELQQRGIAIPFLFCSGYAPRETAGARDAAEAPMLKKPFRSHELLEAVRSVLEPELEQE